MVDRKGSMMKKWLFLCFLCFVSLLNAQTLHDSWKGELNVSGVKLRLVLNIESDGKCTLDSPDQGAKGIPATLEYISTDSLSVSIAVIGARYDGKSINGQIQGVFRQAGQAFPLALQRGTVTLRRPQIPLPPFDYQTEEVEFVNENVGVVLSGTLTYPVGFEKTSGRKVPVVLMITGSGLQNRDEEIYEHKPFAVLADYLAKKGIASLRYDDRSVGKSKGSPKGMTTYTNYEDALSGVDFLKEMRCFDQIGVLGHSEGGTIALMLASRNKKKVDFVISMAGAALGGDSILMEQNYVALRMNGVSDKLAKDYCKVLKKVLLCDSKTDARLDEILSTDGVELPKSLKDNLALVFKSSNSWMDYFVRYNPAEDISRVKCPVMAINGSMDMQVLSSSNLGVLKKLLPANKHTMIKEYPGLNHLFQHCLLGSVSEYGKIEETISVEVLEDIAAWIQSLKFSR